MKLLLTFASLSLLFILFGCNNSSADKQFKQSFDQVKIGEKVWMKKNLNIRVFRNGDSLFHAKTQEEWVTAQDKKMAAWSYYDWDSKNSEYGLLYNFYAITDKRGIAPEGWSIPSAEDWQDLADILGWEGEEDMNRVVFEPKADQRLNPTKITRKEFIGDPDAGTISQEGFSSNSLLWWGTNQGRNHMLAPYFFGESDGLYVRCVKAIK